MVGYEQACVTILEVWSIEGDFRLPLHLDFGFCLLLLIAFRGGLLLLQILWFSLRLEDWRNDWIGKERFDGAYISVILANCYFFRRE
jgi:hypothetical protein